MIAKLFFRISDFFKLKGVVVLFPKIQLEICFPGIEKINFFWLENCLVERADLIIPTEIQCRYSAPYSVGKTPPFKPPPKYFSGGIERPSRIAIFHFPQSPT